MSDPLRSPEIIDFDDDGFWALVDHRICSLMAARSGLLAEGGDRPVRKLLEGPAIAA